MTHPSDDELAGLLVGSSDVDAGTSVHVSDCAQCRQVLVELADVELLIAESADRPLPVPPPSVWEGIRATAFASSEPAGPIPVTAPRPIEATNPIEASNPTKASNPIEATVRDISSGPRLARKAPADRADRRNWARWPLLAAAAVALVVAGMGIGRVVGRDATVQLAATTLRSMDGSQVMGTAEVVAVQGAEQLRVQPTAPVVNPDGFVEVWLINVDGTRMVSVGVVDGPGETILPVPAGALEQGYRIVDLSNEQFDDKPAHSGDSIMRGPLDAV